MNRFLSSLQSHVLERIARADRASDILADVCRAFEQEFPGTIAGVTILNRTLHSFEAAIFPSLAPSYAAALEGIKVEGTPGSCALAVFRGETVVSEDVASDPRFVDGWKQLGQSHGLHALMSIPAFNHEQMALGTFVIGWQPGNRPDEAVFAQAHEVAARCGQILNVRRTQADHELLVGELQHRVRNLFSTIGAVVYSTLKSNPDSRSFRKTFDGRLLAMAKAHALALESHETDLRQLLIDTLAPYSIDHSLTIDGPPIVLTRSAAMAFSLAAHELATNATKYGALSRSGGAIEIGWAIDPADDGEPKFRLRWRESGGPAVALPKHRGYGYQTLTRSLSSAIDGKVEMEFRQDGLLCSITAPHSQRLGSVTH